MRLFVFGHPIAHSLSPFMHTHALSKLGESISYEPLDVLPVDLASSVNMLRGKEMLGANITLPHKERVLPFLDELSEESMVIGAVNTIHNRNGKLFGTTTDPDGILSSIKESGFDPYKKKVVILGSGGSARTVAFAFALKAGPHSICLAARSPGKLAPLEEDLRGRLKFSPVICDIASDQFAKVLCESELLINCTSAGMTPNLETLPLDPGLLHSGLTVYDLVYNPVETALLKAAKEKRCRIISGIGMLLHQGRRSLELWLNREVPIEYFPRELLIEKLQNR